MSTKLHQIVDNIHGTIYCTEFENKIISTPFFNRLHDVNQSSTVYLTFPPNRTKRFEHSLGTMQLTSDIFYNAAINSSSDPALEKLFAYADKEFGKIIDFIKNGENIIINLGDKTLDIIDYINRYYDIDKIKEIICKNLCSVFGNNCLINLAPSGLDSYNLFLFLCLMQSLRIVGLLHDCGHPPQSHIIEKVLADLYDEIVALEKRTVRQNDYKKIIEKYRSLDSKHVNQIDNLMAIKNEYSKNDDLHEMIGVQVVKNIFNYVIPKELAFTNEREVISEKEIIYTLFYLSIVEFVFAILRNKNIFWAELHSVVDGIIDTDRLDFVVRDSQNSGMLWGGISYKRLINTARLGIVEDSLGERVAVCFSDKNIALMDEVLINRYKVFTTINYHHRSTKIACLYQEAVKILMKDYLNATENEKKINNSAYFSDISGLWKTIDTVYSTKNLVLNFIQWNDSWLNGLLHKHMVEDGIKNDDLLRCQNYLKEIFLNERRHYSLIKRYTEFMEINKAMENDISEIKNDITEGITGSKNNIDITSLTNLLNDLEKCNWTGVKSILGEDVFVKSIKKVLEENSIFDYIFKWIDFSLGYLNGNAYIYDNNGEISRYYDYSNIREVLSNIRLSFPYFYIYVNVNTNEKIKDPAYQKKLRKEIGQEIGTVIKLEVKKRINKLLT